MAFRRLARWLSEKDKMVEWMKTSKQALVAVFGLLIASFGVFGTVRELYATPVDRPLVFLFVGVFGVGMLVVAPSVLGNAIKQAFDLFNSVREGGRRATDPPANSSDKN